MAVAMTDSSSYRTEATFTFLTSSVTRRTRVVAHMVLATCLTTLANLLMYGRGRTEFGEIFVTGYTIVAVSRRESMLMSTSSLFATDVSEKTLMTVSPCPLETTVEM